jgi:hypothetical protein
MRRGGKGEPALPWRERELGSPAAMEKNHVEEDPIER